MERSRELEDIADRQLASEMASWPLAPAPTARYRMTAPPELSADVADRVIVSRLGPKTSRCGSLLSAASSGLLAPTERASGVIGAVERRCPPWLSKRRAWRQRRDHGEPGWHVHPLLNRLPHRHTESRLGLLRPLLGRRSAKHARQRRQAESWLGAWCGRFSTWVMPTRISETMGEALHRLQNHPSAAFESSWADSPNGWPQFAAGALAAECMSSRVEHPVQARSLLCTRLNFNDHALALRIARPFIAHAASSDARG